MRTQIMFIIIKKLQLPLSNQTFLVTSRELQVCPFLFTTCSCCNESRELFWFLFKFWALWLWFVLSLWLVEMGLCGFVWIIEVLDRFSRCNSTKEYSGRRIAWLGSGSQHSSHRRVRTETCDVFSGKWVFDNASYPLYNEADCPYMSDQLACHKHGRSDLGYQHWRWQPHNCNLKR